MAAETRFRLPRLFWVGFWLFVVGCGPLLAIGLAAWAGLLADPNPNPVGPGILAFLTFWPAVLLMAGTAGFAALRWLRAR